MKLQVISSLEGLDPYRRDWESLRLDCHASIFTSFDLVRLWLESFRKMQPRVVVAEDRDRLVGVAPMCMHRTSAAGMPVRALTMVGQGKGVMTYSLLSILTKDASGPILPELVRGVKELRWNLLQLMALDPTPSTIRFLGLLKEEFAWQPYVEVSDLFYEFPPEGDIAARFGRNNRASLKRTRRGLEREGRMQVRTIAGGEEAEAAMRTYVQQHRERWSGKGGSMFADERNAVHLERMARLVVSGGIGIVHELLIDGEVAAQSLALLDGDLARGYRIGMVDRFEEFSPGKLLLMLVMEDLRERGLKGYDLLRGDEEYKRHMMTSERTLPAVQVLRGSLLTMSKVRNLPPVRRLDERLKVRDKVLRRMDED